MAGLLIPLLVAAVLGGTFLANEWSGGAVSATLGMGPHTMFAGPHACAMRAPMAGMPGACAGPEAMPHG